MVWLLSSFCSCLHGLATLFSLYFEKCLALLWNLRIMSPVPKHGEMSEWLKEHAWKACIRSSRIGGSNPPLTAITKAALSCFFRFWAPYFSGRLQGIPCFPQQLNGLVVHCSSFFWAIHVWLPYIVLLSSACPKANSQVITNVYAA